MASHETTSEARCQSSSGRDAVIKYELDTKKKAPIAKIALAIGLAVCMGLGSATVAMAANGNLESASTAVAPNKCDAPSSEAEKAGKHIADAISETADKPTRLTDDDDVHYDFVGNVFFDSKTGSYYLVEENGEQQGTANENGGLAIYKDTSTGKMYLVEGEDAE